MQDYKWNQKSSRLTTVEDLGRQQFPEAILSVNLSLLTLPFCPTTLCLATHESAILANDGPKMTNSTTLGLVTSLKMMMMVVGVLNFADPQNTPPSENLAILKILGHQDPVCCFASVPVRAIRDLTRVFQCPGKKKTVRRQRRPCAHLGLDRLHRLFDETSSLTDVLV